MPQIQQSQIQQSSSYSPLLSFAIPIRNGERFLPRLLDSLLAQDFSNFEIVISDNASTDRTAEVCQQYCLQDQRIRYHRNSENIGLNANFNLLITLAQGKYMRWIGADDRLEPDYARKCVAALEARPDLIGVTTYQDFIDDHGNRDYCEYTGDRLDFPQAHKRYARMVWFMSRDFRYIDPIYTMVRRDVLAEIGGHKPVLGADQVLAVELSLHGAFGHIPECLAHRGWHFSEKLWPSRDQVLQQNFHKDYSKVKQQTYLNVVWSFWQPVLSLPLSWSEKLLCVPTITYYLFRISYIRFQERLMRQLRELKRTVPSYYSKA
jgi:glycosyltransferase involved in cell wall biosynthesis